MRRVTRMQCTRTLCGWSTIATLDGSCFCGAKMVLVADEEAIDAIADGEIDEVRADEIANLLSLPVLGYRR